MPLTGVAEKNCFAFLTAKIWSAVLEFIDAQRNSTVYRLRLSFQSLSVVNAVVKASCCRCVKSLVLIDDRRDLLNF